MKNDILENEEVNVFSLILKLRQEKLLVRNEKSNIQDLNELIRCKTHKIIRAAWITTKQRLLLHQREASSQTYQDVDYIHNSEFIEAKKALGFQNAIKVGSLLQVLRSQPAQLAKWLIIGEQMAEESKNYSLILQSIVVGLYGCFIFPEDTKSMLTLLYELAKLQLLNSDNPRRIIKQRTCSFKHLYFLFHDVLQSAKFFLNVALEIPIIQLMSCTDFYLDVDPDKSIMRYNQDESEITNLFKDAVDYRREVVLKLVQVTNAFITSLLENVYSFPKSISWIVCHISKIIEKSFGSKEANSIITELIFTLYICPVIVDPEQYGICNSQVTDIARHNLIQVGQILQSLALNKFEPTDPKHADLFELLDKNRVNNFIELLFFDMDNEEPPIDTSPAITRDIMLFTEAELNNLVSILQKVNTIQKQSDNFVKDEESIEDQLLSLSLSSKDNSPRSSRLTTTEEITSKKPNFFSLGSKNHITRSVSEEIKPHCNVVLIFPIDQAHSDPIGFLPEEKIIDLSIPVKTEETFEATPPKISSSMPNTPNQNGDIKQSFNFQDEGSIGNTSDNLEAISEAASNHSVDSSIELENEDQNDNLSDMVSANVSGRGTPNISGRDTPSSQVCENDDRIMAEARPADSAQPQQNISRQIRSEIDDKFCKFEIKKLLEGDETISIISETWSTDVLASDNETIDAGDSRHERQSLQLVDQAIQEVPIGNILDISETQSESAWSTDVMASDTERLTEVDNDDTVSVAQSDDTNSVARSDDTRSETDENLGGIRRLSSSSNSYISHIPMANNQNYISTVTVSNTTNYLASANNPFISNGSVTNVTFLPSLPTNSTNSCTSTTNYVTSSNFQEYRKVDIKNDRINGKIYRAEHTDNNANTVFKSLTLNNSEHSLAFSESSGETKSSVFNSIASTVTTIVNNRGQNSLIKESDMSNIPGPSGLNKKFNKLVEAENEFVQQNRTGKKYDDRPNEILLSNCSLNSSSSGSSSNSFENKNSHNENSEAWEGKQWLNSSGSSLNVTLTPSESTSELSVLSVNNITNPVNIINKKSITLLNNRNLKPSVSTGAIPKSISFDMSADKGLDEDSRCKRGGFLGKLRIFKSRNRGKTFRNQDDYRLENDDFGSTKKLLESPVKINNNIEMSDDILAKYRKPFVESSPIKENCDVSKSPKGRSIVSINKEEVNSFNDIKNKLRLVLSNTSEIPHYVKDNPITAKNKIETVLRLELGKARTLREWSNVARISEAIRCVNLLNDSSCLKLLKSMREDIILRTTYIQYLVTSKQELLFCNKYLDSLHNQIMHDKQQCEKYLATLCVREFLSKQESKILKFCDEFKQLSLSDEKCDSLQNFYRDLLSSLNGSSLWQDVSLDRNKAIKMTLERFIMSKIYKNSIYPNGDGDRDRDSVLREHIEKLSKIITPHHKDLMIHKVYLRECPWLPAQDALRALNAYKTPRDKVKCVVHCAKCIMDLLSLSQSNGSTTADDFTPVLVYVIIKVNPEALLSTVQYVNSFFHNQLFGEEEYWWTQFCAAVEYIKTMDYSD